MLPEPTNRREAILLATREAATLHEKLGLRSEIKKWGGQIDVFRAITDLDISLLFRPLKGLWGVAIRQVEAETILKGVLVTTKLSLAVQRFTAAHELGHIILEHTGSLDRQVGQAVRLSHITDLKEVAADAFAAEFLIPKWLILHHALRQNWNTTLLSSPDTAYQLSLRLGVSYEATCWGLQSHKILSPDSVSALLKVQPKSSKNKYLREVECNDDKNPWADVWVLTERDTGICGAGSPDDFLLVKLREQPSTGFLWDLQFLPDGATVIIDRRDNLDLVQQPIEDARIGATMLRKMVIRPGGPGVCRLHFAQVQPWNKDASPREQLDTIVSLFGKEEPGLPRHVKATLN